MISRWGNDDQYRVESAKMLAILLHMQKGTPYIYQGEEIGMTNTAITDISQARDIETINMYHERLANGYAKEDIIHSINVKGRDNARRPVQWNNHAFAGFSTVEPWIAVNDNYEKINVEQALADPDSIFYTYQKLLALRKANPIMIWGDFVLVDTQEEVFAYLRKYQGETWLIVTNFSNEAHDFKYDNAKAKEIVIENMPVQLSECLDLTLKPWQAFVVKLEA